MHTIQIDSSALGGHMSHTGALACAPDVIGYCGAGFSTAIMSDTSIQLKVISWQEVKGDLVKAP